jgi:hypothetical protein
MDHYLSFGGDPMTIYFDDVIESSDSSDDNYVFPEGVIENLMSEAIVNKSVRAQLIEIRNKGKQELSPLEVLKLVAKKKERMKARGREIERIAEEHARNPKPPKRSRSKSISVRKEKSKRSWIKTKKEKRKQSMAQPK